MVQPKKTPANQTNGSNKRETQAMSFSKKDGSDTRASGKSNAASFRTDSAISSGRAGAERTLQRWVPDKSDDYDYSLEAPASNTNGPKWDQFAENQRLFGITTDYKEDYYTTSINKTDPDYKKRRAFADKKASEIERSTAGTAHVAEERVMDYVGGEDTKEDEEDKYSGVKRQQQDFPPLPGHQSNKYTPPARRAPTGTNSVKGVPVDPAIISSQLKKSNSNSKPDDTKNRPSSTDATQSTQAGSSAAAAEAKVDNKAEPLQTNKSAEVKPSTQGLTQSKSPAATQAKDAAAPSATSTVERDVLNSFKTFANEQRLNAEKARSSKAKADKQVKLHELKKFASNFKLPTPVPVDLIGIIAKDPDKQREIQEKAQRDVSELAKKKAEDVTKDKAKPASTEAQPAAAVQPPTDTRGSRNAANPASSGPANGQNRNRQNFVPTHYPSFPANRGAGPHMQQQGRGRLSARIQGLESKGQGIAPDARLPPTGPANTMNPNYRMGAPNYMSAAKLNPSSHEFRPSAATFSPNGHISTASSPRSAAQNGPDHHATPTIQITRKRRVVDQKKCNILSHVKAQPTPETKNWSENGGLQPSFDTLPTWRSIADDEKPESSMRLTFNEYFEKQPFTTQATPNPPHAMPQLAHQHQLPFHLQHGAHNMAPRQSPHVSHVQMHGGQHGPVPHAPYNGGDDHRMMHSNSTQSYSSPRMGQVPMAYAPSMNGPGQMPYNQPGVPSFMGPGQPPMNQYNRSFSSNGSYMPQQPAGMGASMMMPPQFMPQQGMPPQMQMYPGQQFIPGTAPQPIPGNTNGYPSPGRPTAPMMVHQGSQQGQPMYGMSPGMPYQQPAFAPPQQGQMRGYGNPNQQFGTSPSQAHQYGPNHRNGNNLKGYQGHNQHQGNHKGAPQHSLPSGPQGHKADAPDEAK